MRMKDPIPTFSYIVQQIAERYPNFAFLHVIEPRVDASTDRTPSEEEVSCCSYHDLRGLELTQSQSNDFIRKIWHPRPFISAGGYNRELSVEAAETKGDLIAWGRYYVSNVSRSL